jgi:hypothetical protein
MVKEYFDLYDNEKELPSITDMETITVTTTKQFSGVAHYRELNDKDDETKSLSKQIWDERCERQLKKEDALFIAVAWIVKPAFCYSSFARKLSGWMLLLIPTVKASICLHFHQDCPLGSR